MPEFIFFIKGGKRKNCSPCKKKTNPCRLFVFGLLDDDLGAAHSTSTTGSNQTDLDERKHRLARAATWSGGVSRANTQSVVDRFEPSGPLEKAPTAQNRPTRLFSKYKKLFST